MPGKSNTIPFLAASIKALVMGIFVWWCLLIYFRVRFLNKVSPLLLIQEVLVQLCARVKPVQALRIPIIDLEHRDSFELYTRGMLSDCKLCGPS